MGSVGVLIVFAVLGAFICAKARVAAGAVVFSLIALALFVGTPVGSVIPRALAGVVSSVGQASVPLTGQTGASG